MMICMNLLIATCLASATALPSTTMCNADIGCETGYYCSTDFACRPCLRCHDLKREAPPLDLVCITSVLQCGPCIIGTQEDRFTNECVSPAVNTGVPTWAVIAIVMGALLLFSAICAMAVYILRNSPHSKIFVSATIQPQYEHKMEEASAPPPPYNLVAVLSDRNPESLPFIQAIPKNQTDEQRRQTEKQGAVVFNLPAYLREPQFEPSDQPPSENPPVLESVAEVEETSLANDNEIARFDEDAQSSAAPGPIKVQRVRQDSNNSNGSSKGGDNTHSFFFNAANGVPLTFNVVNNLQPVQHNNVMV